MKKYLTLMAFYAVIISCNNTASTSTSTTPTGTDSLSKIAPLSTAVPSDTAMNKSDSAKVKRAMRK